MPTYQYACTVCGHSFEQFQSFSDDSLEHCPECNGRLRKVFNAVGVVFKGSGFYRNDSRAAASGEGTSGAAPKVATKDSAASSSSESSSGSTRESSSGSTRESSSGSTGESSSPSKESSSGAKPAASSSGSSSSTSSD